jgi:hypothetical protein
MATTTRAQTITLPFKQKAIADRVEQAEAALDHLSGLGVIELPRPLRYWQSEIRALAAALDATEPAPKAIPGLVV